MAWVKRIKIVDVDVVTKGIRTVAEDWSETDDKNVANALYDVARNIGLPPDQVLTDRQMKKLRNLGVL